MSATGSGSSMTTLRWFSSLKMHFYLFQADFLSSMERFDGWGVFASKPFEKGSFLLIYPGELISEEEGEKREEEIPSVFRYFFSFKGKTYCVDGTSEPLKGPCLGRLVNHERKRPNAKMRVIQVGGRPYLALFALNDIKDGDEIQYDYGPRKLPWEVEQVKENSTSFKEESNVVYVAGQTYEYKSNEAVDNTKNNTNEISDTKGHTENLSDTKEDTDEISDTMRDINEKADTKEDTVTKEKIGEKADSNEDSSKIADSKEDISKIADTKEDSKIADTKEDISKIADSKEDISEMTDTKEDSKIADSKEDISKIADSKEDSKIADSKEDSKIADSKEDISKIADCKEDSKIADSKEDISKIADSKEDSKIADSKEDIGKIVDGKEDINEKADSKEDISEMTDTKEDSKIADSKEDSKIADSKEDSKAAYSKEDSKIAYSKEDSKIAYSKEDSKIADSKEDISEMIDTREDISKIADGKEDINEKADGKEDINEKTDNKEDSKIADSKEDISEITDTKENISKIADSKEDSKIADTKEDISKIADNKEDSKIADSKEDISEITDTKENISKIADSMQDSKIADSKEDSKIADSKEDSKAADSKEDSKIADSKEDSKAADSKEDSKIADSKEDSKAADSKEDSKIADSKEDSKAAYSKEDSKIADSKEDISEMTDTKENITAIADTKEDIAAIIDLTLTEPVVCSEQDAGTCNVVKLKCYICDQEFFCKEDLENCQQYHSAGVCFPSGPYPRKGGRWSQRILKMTGRKMKTVNTIKFSKEDQIASGSRGKVYLGSYNGQPIAVKRIETDKLMENELKVSSLLDNKVVANILPQICVEKDEDFTYLASQLCEYNLKEVVEQPTCSFQLTSDYCMELCCDFLQGIHNLHGLGIIHRDIKPENLLIDVMGKLHVADFGVSKVLHLGKTTIVTTFAGTCAWMAPEACDAFFTGCEFQYKKSSDVQVAGCILHYILSRGHHPFESTSPFNDDLVGLRRNITRGCYKIHPLHSVPSELRLLIEQMIHSEPKERPEVGKCLDIFKTILAKRYNKQMNAKVRQEGNKNNQQPSPVLVCPTTKQDSEENISSQNEVVANISEIIMEQRIEQEDTNGKPQHIPVSVSPMTMLLGIDGAIGQANYTTESEEDILKDNEVSLAEAQEIIRKENGVSGVTTYSKDTTKNEVTMACCYQERLFSDSDSNDDRDEDYIPPSVSESESEFTDGNEKKTHRKKIKLLKKSKMLSVPKKRQKLMERTSNGSSGSSAKKGREQQKSKVKVTSKKNGKRVMNKPQYCLYCKSSFVQLSRHLFTCHGAELDVAKAASFPKKSKERNILLEKIRNEGNFNHNKKVWKTGEGEVIPWRCATSESVHTDDYLPCLVCKGLFAKDSLRRHRKTCRMSPKEESSAHKRKLVQSEAATMVMFVKNDGFAVVGTELENILSKMQYDDISKIVKSDPLILQFGADLCATGNFQEGHYVSCKMRELGRFLLEVRKINPSVTSLAGCLSNRQNFSVVVQATQMLAGMIEGDKSVKVPSLVMKLGQSVKKALNILHCEAIQSANKSLEEEVTGFQTLMNNRWQTKVLARARKAQRKLSWNKPQRLPLTKDVKCLNRHLSNLSTSALTSLKETTSVESWKTLCETTLTQVIIFNRRRSGEVGKLTLETYNKKGINLESDEIMASLSPLERRLYTHFTRIETEGKRQNKVAILLPPNLKEAIDVLNSKRSDVGISKSNNYVFARVHYQAGGHVRGSDVLRKYANECGAKNPEYIRSTKLRKQVATVAQILEMGKSELKQLSTFMGHSQKVHETFYRLPEDAYQTAKVSKILLAMEKGNMHQFRGQTLDEIKFDPTDYVESEESDSDTDDTDIVKPVPSEHHSGTCSGSGSSGNEKKEDSIGNVTGNEEQMECIGIDGTGNEKEECISGDGTGNEKEGCISGDGTGNEKEECISGDGTGNEKEECISGDGTGNEKEECISGFTGIKERKQELGRSSRKKKKEPWTPKELNILKLFFKDLIKLRQAPGQKECKECIQKHPEILGRRDWKLIKWKVCYLSKMEEKKQRIK
ncbi:uncharacterized protein [Ptychodera flava]|uniref:uncharacterized protein isoform X2 n=1 Tax=Ptychodera flava TaxID=63121 RepID=UPI00396A5CD7